MNENLIHNTTNCFFPISLENFLSAFISSSFHFPPLAINFSWFINFSLLFSDTRNKILFYASGISKNVPFIKQHERDWFLFSHGIAVFLISFFLHRMWRNHENCERKIFTLKKLRVEKNFSLEFLSLSSSLIICSMSESKNLSESFRENMKIILLSSQTIINKQATTAQYDMMIERHRTQI